MSTDNEAGYVEFKPTIWHRLGFNYAHAKSFDDTEHPDMAEAWLCVETYSQLSWIDRLRVLISGKVHIQAKTKTDVVVRHAITNSAFSVLPPTHKFRSDRFKS